MILLSLHVVILVADLRPGCHCCQKCLSLSNPLRGSPRILLDGNGRISNRVRLPHFQSDSILGGSGSREAGNRQCETKSGGQSRSDQLLKLFHDCSFHIHPIDFRFCCHGLSFHSTLVSPPIRSVYNKVKYFLAFNTYPKGIHPLGSAYADPSSPFFMGRLLWLKQMVVQLH